MKVKNPILVDKIAKLESDREYIDLNNRRDELIDSINNAKSSREAMIIVYDQYATVYNRLKVIAKYYGLKYTGVSVNKMCIHISNKFAAILLTKHLNKP